VAEIQADVRGTLRCGRSGIPSERSPWNLELQIPVGLDRSDEFLPSQRRCSHPPPSSPIRTCHLLPGPKQGHPLHEHASLLLALELGCTRHHWFRSLDPANSANAHKTTFGKEVQPPEPMRLPLESSQCPRATSNRNPFEGKSGGGEKKRRK
jgi:hypothetical protein